MRPDGGFIYAVSEINEAEGKPGGLVTAFAVDKTSGMLKALNKQWDGGATDPSKTYEYATAHNIKVDKFVSITDNEVNCGQQHTSQALAKYRQKSGVAAKSVIIGTSVSKFTLADPKDAGMLDIAGFDSAAPQLIAQL